MGEPAFRPEQFELAFLGEWRSYDTSSIALNTEVASHLANGVFDRSNAHRQPSDRWPEDTQVTVALGLTSSYGADRRPDGDGFIDKPHALFGIGFEPKQPLEVSTVYMSYMEAVQRALDLDEIEKYRAQGTLAVARHLGRVVGHDYLRRRYDRRLEHRISEMLLTIPRPLEPLLERTT